MKNMQTKKEKKTLKRNFDKMMAAGTMLYLDEQLATASRLSDVLLRENGQYMGDYVADDSGMIREVHYHRVHNFS